MEVSDTAVVLNLLQSRQSSRRAESGGISTALELDRGSFFSFFFFVVVIP